MIVIMIIFSNALCKLELFYDKLGMAYIQSIKQSMIKLNINKHGLWLHFVNKLFITKMFLTFLISIYKSVQN